MSAKYGVPMNMFRLTNGQLDKKHLRVCATFKLLKQERITADRAIELLAERNVNASVVSHWKNHLAKQAQYREIHDEEVSMTSGMKM